MKKLACLLLALFANIVPAAALPAMGPLYAKYAAL